MITTPPEVPVGGQLYRIGKLDAMSQLHVVRRIAPVLTKTGNALAEMVKVGEEKADTDVMLVIMEAAMDVVAEMKDADFEYVVKACLSVVHRQDSDAWVLVHNGRSFQYQDIDMPDVIRLVVEVLKENLGRFFAGLGGGTPT